jgi:hypothetical protein
LLEAVSQQKGIEVLYPDDELTPKELEEIESSLQSGFRYDIENLRAKLRG